MKKSPSNQGLAIFLLDYFKENPFQQYPVEFSEAFSEAVMREIAQKCTEPVLRYLEREAKLERLSFTDYFMKKMAHNRLLKVLSSDLAQLAVVELASIYAEPKEATCPRASNPVVQGMPSHQESGTDTAQERNRL